MDQELKHAVARIISIAFFAILTVVVVCSTSQISAVWLLIFVYMAILADVIVGFFVPSIKIEA